MKKTIIFVMFFVFFAFVIPGTSLFADIGIGSRFEAGLDLAAFPASASTVDEDEHISMIPIIPLLDLGLYGNFSFGIFHAGVGIRGLSLIIVNAFWPSAYAELNLWRFTLNARIGGGVLYLFPVYLIAGPYLVPELSLWYTLTTFKKDVNQLRLGFGAITLLSTQTIKMEELREFYNNVVFYLGVKFSFNS